MSRSNINPKTGKNLFSIPDNGSDCILIGRICFIKGAPCYNTKHPHEGTYSDDRPETWMTLPYHATRPECQKIAQALLDVTDEELQNQLNYGSRLVGPGYTLEQFRQWVTKLSGAFKRLKYGYIEAGDEYFVRIEQMTLKLMPRALLWSVTDTEEKYREWLQKPNQDFAGNFAPIDFLRKSLEPGFKSCYQVVAAHIENRIAGMPH